MALIINLSIAKPVIVRINLSPIYKKEGEVSRELLLTHFVQD
jgi:hypothetical protein